MVKPPFVFFTLLVKIRFVVKGHFGLGERTQATQGFISLKMGSISHHDFQGGCTKIEKEEGQGIEEDAQSFHGVGVCKWFNVRMGFGFLSMNRREGVLLEVPVDVFVHQSKLHMEGFRSLKEGEEVEFNFKKSSKGLESVRVTGPGGVHCIGSEKRPKGKTAQKRRSKGDRCYNCGGLDHHAKECKLPPQPKKCHFCQCVSHMVANCPAKAQQSSPSSQETPFSLKGKEEMDNYSPPPTEIIN
ncbi:protein lin-28 homolog A isoform X1 [Tachysurus vachellii]|uniref:protein lin-28 homolog A isoform X1 n=1 Tax=Tachysurus vachellii TaxID=175792 RepID=UPI00296ACC18|nr:protein lin-28 homolog A isoform X1 [Tachysurus vachellii]XP_060725996.1 protein lin-28 homolog A isoform X1 [Tachysurus vachellii]